MGKNEDHVCVHTPGNIYIMSSLVLGSFWRMHAPKTKQGRSLNWRQNQAVMDSNHWEGQKSCQPSERGPGYDHDATRIFCQYSGV